MVQRPEPAAQEDLIPIARVDRIRGISGEVVATVHADDPGRMGELGSVLILQKDGGHRKVVIRGVKRLGARAVLKLEGFETIEEAQALVGKEMFIPIQASTPAPPGRYYAYQLVGLSVRLKDGSVVGMIREVLKPGPQSLLVVDGPRGEILVPMARQIVVSIDVKGGTVTLDPPEGLLELNETPGSGR